MPPLISTESRVNPISAALIYTYYKKRGRIIHSRSELIRVALDGFAAILKNNFVDMEEPDLQTALTILENASLYHRDKRSESRILNEMQKINIKENKNESRAAALMEELEDD